MSESVWSKERAEKWYMSKPWLVGCNFIPSNAVNQLEMWQEGTFDPRMVKILNPVKSKPVYTVERDSPSRSHA